MSWIVINRQTGESVCEIWNDETLEHINWQKYGVTPTLSWLQYLNWKSKQNANDNASTA